MELSQLNGIGPTRLKAFHAAGIRSLRDLLYMLPVKYRDTSKVSTIEEADVGDKVCLQLTREGPPKLFRKGKMCRISCHFSDSTGVINAVWFNQIWMKQILENKTKMMLYGRVERYGNQKQIMNPVIETEPRIIPVYKPIEGVPQKIHEQAVKQALAFVEELFVETLPKTLIGEYRLMSMTKAINALHNPQDMETLRLAQRRFSFEQMLLYQIAVRIAGEMRKNGPDMAIPSSAADFWSSMPFAPTGAQRRTVQEIICDMSGRRAMARMVQGDVGSGKTAVAMGAMTAAAKSGFQSALMVPTEILARQHYASMLGYFTSQGITCGLLLGGMPASQRKKALAAISTGEWQVIIGTHALISKSVHYQNLGLAITDEQHRFGVAQRTQLINKGANDTMSPHLLVMSATPIPRSLALVLFGDLDLSVIDELPPGRLPVTTRIVPEEKRSGMYEFIRKTLQQGQQVYIVCPLVEASDGEDSLKAVKEHAAQLKKDVFPEWQIGLTYGTQPSDEKAAVLDRFSAGDIQILVATTVIEVGVNVPNATLMVIEDADRYGLAQLHQLRGRVGRGQEQSWCFLLAKPNERLKTLVSTNDGFRVANADLEQRGPGELLGTRQHGDDLLPGGTAAFGDMKLLYEAAQCAEDICSDPERTEEKDILAKLASGLVERLNERVSFS